MKVTVNGEEEMEPAAGHEHDAEHVMESGHEAEEHSHEAEEQGYEADSVHGEETEQEHSPQLGKRRQRRRERAGNRIRSSITVTTTPRRGTLRI